MHKRINRKSKNYRFQQNFIRIIYRLDNCKIIKYINYHIRRGAIKPSPLDNYKIKTIIKYQIGIGGAIKPNPNLKYHTVRSWKLI